MLPCPLQQEEDTPSQMCFYQISLPSVKRLNTNLLQQNIVVLLAQSLSVFFSIQRRECSIVNKLLTNNIIIQSVLIIKVLVCMSTCKVCGQITRSPWFKTNNVINLRFVKISNVNI